MDDFHSDRAKCRERAVERTSGSARSRGLGALWLLSTEADHSRRAMRATAYERTGCRCIGRTWQWLFRHDRGRATRHDSQCWSDSQGDGALVPQLWHLDDAQLLAGRRATRCVFQAGGVKERLPDALVPGPAASERQWKNPTFDVRLRSLVKSIMASPSMTPSRSRGKAKRPEATTRLATLDRGHLGRAAVAEGVPLSAHLTARNRQTLYRCIDEVVADETQAYFTDESAPYSAAWPMSTPHTQGRSMRLGLIMATVVSQREAHTNALENNLESI